MPEINFDGLVGPTHNYSGLSRGNVASTTHRALVSNPKAAALQGLEKMKMLTGLGLIQGVLPPQERPHLPTLRRLGFTGSDQKILAQVVKDYPDLLTVVSSASCMWVANSATVSPSQDTKDHKVHFTPANLISKFHRSIETQTTGRVLKKIFKNPDHFVHHEPLSGGAAFGDEGAANHNRLCGQYEKLGLEFFVFGKYGLGSGAEPRIFPARQTFEASSALARTHGLKGDSVIFAQQAPKAIDAGIFHNDVAGVGNQNVYFCHDQAYTDTPSLEIELKKKFEAACKEELFFVSVSEKDVPLSDVVKSYMFNSQLVTLAPNNMLLILPLESQETQSVKSYLEKLLTLETPIKGVKFLDLRQSMQNGGGPACLRLRVVLSKKELSQTHQKVFLTDNLYVRLVTWVNKHYRDRLEITDIQDPQLLKESRAALEDLTQVLGLGPIYDFQN